MNFTHLTKSQREVYNALHDMDWADDTPQIDATLEMFGRFAWGNRRPMTETVTITAHGKLKRQRRCRCNRGCQVMIDDPEEVFTKVVWINGKLQPRKGFLNMRRGYTNGDRDGMSARLVVSWAQARTLVSRGGTKDA